MWCKDNKNIIGILLLCVINLLFMHNYIIISCQIEDPLDWTSWVDNLCRVVFDVWVVMTLLLIFFHFHLRRVLIFTYILTLIWSFANILYSRFFFHYLTLSSLSEASAMADGLVFNSMLAGLRWEDLFFLLSFVLFVILWSKCDILYPIQLWKYLRQSFVVLASLFFINLFSHAVFCVIQPELRYWGYYSRRVGHRMFGSNYLLATPIHANFHNGSVKSLVIETAMSFQGNINLSDEQSNKISQVLECSKSTMLHGKRPNVKNVVFILVESQMSFAIDKKVSGKEVTPVLNSLKKDSCVYFNGRMQPNITLGESSDGQYIYMTGLLPLRSMITVTKACKRLLPGLPRQLRKIGINNSRMILPTSSSLWRQDEMCQQYGFDRLYASNDYWGVHEQTLTDEQVFELASKIDSIDSKEPFFSIVLTASMHQPYDKIIDPSFIIEDKVMDGELKCYLNACHYTDRIIGWYLESLKEKGLYDNSLIIIASDHHVHSTDLGGGIPVDIPLFIINSGMGENAYFGPCNQVDVYTTLMDILSVPDTWSGVGSSLLNPRYKELIGKDQWDISEWILLSDYFRKNSLVNL